MTKAEIVEKVRCPCCGIDMAYIYDGQVPELSLRCGPCSRTNSHRGVGWKRQVLYSYPIPELSE